MASSQVITACAFIHHNFGGTEKVFMARRASTKEFLPGEFELPGGHIDYGEDIVEGLRREVLEELGMNIKVEDPFAAFTYTDDTRDQHVVEVIYFAEFADPIENIEINSKDHSEYNWLAEDEIQRVVSGKKTEKDPEIQSVRKGFSLLKERQLLFR